MLSRDNKIRLLMALKKVVTYRQTGICCQVNDNLTSEDISLEDLRDIRKDLDRRFLTWPEWSGNTRYPVPASPGNMDKVRAEMAYWHAAHTGILWEGTYGIQRKNLLNYLITQVSIEVYGEPALRPENIDNADADPAFWIFTGAMIGAFLCLIYVLLS